ILPPEATIRFNFRRVPLPPEKAGKSIVLRGILTEEGNIEDLEVYQGLLPLMDEAARSAFQRWKFKPAMRSGRPLRV
ncbi:energy transducer TonB, partial [Klebsiella pneumoniae]|nr:energy transducer TonB [Klebsiella pneumoniae]